MNLAQVKKTIASGNRREAEECLLAFEKACGASSATYELRGSLAAKDGNLDLAQIEFKRAVELDSTNWSALASFGLIEVQRGDADGLKKIHQAIESSRPSESLLLKRAEALRVMKRYGDARVQMRNLLKQFPDSLPGWRTMAAIEQASGNRRLHCDALEHICHNNGVRSH